MSIGSTFIIVEKTATLSLPQAILFSITRNIKLDLFNINQAKIREKQYGSV
jgi:hypothetical protein